jgi:hypothetical protein
VCSGLIVIGASLALSPWRAEIPPLYFPAVGVAGGGWILVLAGIWFGVDDQGGSYWHPEGSGHGIGVLFLILLAAWILAAVVGMQSRTAAGPLLAAAVALVLLGLGLVVPLLSVLNDLDSLRTGAWLPLGGGVLLSIGSSLALRTLPTPASPAERSS